MPYPHYTLNFADGSHFDDDADAKRAITEAAKAAKAGQHAKKAGIISIGVKGSHTTFMDVGGHRFTLDITHHNEAKDREPILDIIIKPA
jgi:hypothetical protein